MSSVYYDYHKSTVLRKRSKTGEESYRYQYETGLFSIHGNDK